MEKSRLLDLTGTPRHEQLYLYSKILQEQMAMKDTHDPELTFTPQVNNYDCERTRMTFYERQQMDCHNREYKQKLTKEIMSTANIRKNMQPELYKPAASAFRGEPGATLYDDAFKQKSTLESKRRQKDLEYKQLANEQKSIATSSQIVDRIADARLASIFETLDSDGDGLINYSRINVEGIDPRVCKVLSPLFLELNDRPDVSLDVRAFSIMVKEFIKVGYSH